MDPRYSPHPLFNARVDTIGDDRAPVLIVDHFCSDPDGLVRDAELAFARTRRQRESFPGIVTAADEVYARQAVGHLMPMICRAFGVSGRIQTGGFDFQILTSPPEQLSPKQRRPHYDLADVDVVASVLFLCRPPFLGTAFYRHNPTGFEVITPDRVAVYGHAMGAPGGGAASGGYMSGDTAEFTQIANYDAVYNRMILFSAASLHSACAVRGHGFSSDPKTGRLTANLFLKFAK